MRHGAITSRPRSEAFLARASRYLPGGVSSDVRLGGTALYFVRGEGATLHDADGNAYVDYVLGMGPLVLGHNPPAVVAAVQEQAARGFVFGGQHELELLVAEQIAAAVPCAEMMRFNSVGSEAVHGAIRLARGFTGRQKVLKFEGHYHGWLDPVLYSTQPPLEKAGPRERPNVVPMSGGMAASTAGDLLVAPWNDLPALETILRANRDEVAAVIMEPILCNTGCIMPKPGYLEGVQRLCRQHGALLILDEVITGFRIGLGGAQAYLGITPDLATFGKAVAAGLPLSVVAGRAEIMQLITERKVMHAGTFNSNPLVMAAAHAALAELASNDGEAYRRLFKTGGALRDGLNALAARYGVPLVAEGPGPMIQVYFNPAGSVTAARDALATDLAARDRFIRGLLDRRVRATSRGLFFLSTAHGDAEVLGTLEAAEAILKAW